MFGFSKNSSDPPPLRSDAASSLASGLEPMPEAPSTGSLWANMFGLGPLFKMLADPEFQRSASAVGLALQESARISLAIDAKLDMILEHEGYDIERINQAVAVRAAARHAEQRRLAGISSPDGSPGAGPAAAASPALDNGGRLDA